MILQGKKVMSSANTNPGGKERRRYFRIEDEVLFNCSILSDEEKKTQMDRLKSGDDLCPDLYHTFLMLESDILDLIKKAKKENPLLAQAIEILNRKINVISKGPPSKQAQQKSLYDTEPQHINLSGCGLAFMSPQEMQEKTFLQLEVVLLPGNQYILCIGEVVSCEKVPLSPHLQHSSEKPFRVGVNFIAIRPDDTEKIIQHVIKREAEALRDSKRHLS